MYGKLYLYIQDRKREYEDENGSMKEKRLFGVYNIW